MTKLIIYILMYFIEGLIALYYLNHSFKCTKSKKVVLSTLFLTYSIQIWIFSCNNVTLNMLSFTVMNYVLCKHCFDSSHVSCFIHSIIMSISMSLTEMVAANLFDGSFTQYNDVTDMPLPMSLLFIFISKTLYFICLFIVQLFCSKSSFSYNPFNKKSIVVLLTSILSFAICVFLLFISFHNTLTKSSQYAMIGVSSLLVLFNCFIIWMHESLEQQSNKIYLLELEKQQNLEAAKYHARLMQQAEELKGLRHDIKNHLLNIQAKYESGHTEEASAYVDTLLNKDSLTHFFQPTTCDNLNLILARYCSLCQDHGIIFRANVQNSDVNFLSFEEITTIFCNLLDNAYEAAVACENPFIDLDITTSKSEHKTIITMINSCKAAPIPNSDSPFFLSSKDDSTYHGFGLRNVQRVVKTYNGKIDTYFSEEEKEFHTILFLNAPKEGEKNENSNL